MFLIPIGHEDLSVRRAPWATIGIAAVCFAIQVYVWKEEARLDAPISALSERADRALKELVQDCLQQGTCSPQVLQDPAALIAGVRERRIGQPEQQDRFIAVYDELMEVASVHPVRRLGFRPGTDGVWHVFSAMFTHAGLSHLLGNMLFLFLVGTSMEERWGRPRFLIFYLLGGCAATAAYSALQWGSDVPIVGASGAIAAAMGAFALLHFRTRIRFFYFILIKVGTFSAPAWLVLPLWFLEQLWSTAEEAATRGGVAYSAHAGGFAFGALVALAIRVIGLDERFSQEVDRATGGWSEDPLLTEAQALVDRGQLPQAMARLEQLLAKAPDDPMAKPLLFELAARTRNTALLQRLGPELFARWARQDPPRVLEAYRALTRELPDAPVDERILQHVLTAARTQGDGLAGEDVLRRLYRDYPRSGHLPRALATMAELYGRAGKVELEHECLLRLTRDFPLDPWSERARARMAEITS
ncbi:MAG: rhomboid family intramembrane serine protease [Myxococcales bacterium]|nr:rhomboid family intramembrane serine protease [Myxococcales bacterium]